MLEVLIAVNGREVDRLKIINDSTGTDKSSNYNVSHSFGGFTITGHDRAEGAWSLAEKAIKKYREVESLSYEKEQRMEARMFFEQLQETLGSKKTTGDKQP